MIYIMNIKRLYSTGAIIIICTIIATIQAASAAPTISVEPSYLSVSQGDDFTVNVTIDPCGDEVMGAQYKLYFNNILLRALSQNKDSFLSRDSASTVNIVNKIDNPAGRIEYGEMRTGVTNGVNTSGTLTTIKFEARSSGSGELRLYDVVLSDPNVTEIPGVIVNNATVEIAQSLPSTPFVIGGYVSYKDGTPCNDPAVNITNLNISKEWTTETEATSNYYQIMLASGADVIAGETLQFDVTNGTVFSVANHTIIAREVDDGGLFNFNLTLGTPALNVVVNEFVSKSNPEWIELYNPTGSDVSLDGWTIKDGAGNSLADLNGETLPVNGYLVFDFSNKLNDGGDIIYLNTSTTTVDKVAYGDWDDGNVDDNAPKPEDNESAGRYPNGVDTNNDGADFILFDTPTHGTENVVSGDTTPPIVISHAPTGTGVPVSTNITATFNESMNPDTLNNETVTVEHNGTAVAGNITYDASSKTVTFDPADDLNYSETYNATITTGVQDIAGNNISSNVIWNFTTGSRVIEVTISIGNASGNVTVPITIKNAANIGSAHINLTYNASVCMITDVTNGTFDCTFANLEHNETGWASIGAFQTDNPGLNGSVVLANVAFRSNSTNGTSPLNMSVVTFTDVTPQCNRIPYITQNGTYTAALNGDVNGDGNVTITDAMYLAKHVLGITGFEVIIVGAADVNGDGVINIADAMYLAKHVLGKSGFEELR